MAYLCELTSHLRLAWTAGAIWKHLGSNQDDNTNTLNGRLSPAHTKGWIAWLQP